MLRIGLVSIGIIIVLVSAFLWSPVRDSILDLGRPSIDDKPLTEPVAPEVAKDIEGKVEQKAAPVVSPPTPSVSSSFFKEEVIPHFEYVPPSPKASLPAPSPAPLVKEPVEPSIKELPDLATATTSEVEKVETKPQPPKPALPPLDEDAIFKAVVKIECPTKNDLGKYIGSGFLLEGGKIVTAAHVIKDSGSEECTVIFPRERKPVHYLKGRIRDFDELEDRLDEKGIDFALIDLPAIESYPEAKAIFDSYPYVPYTFCEDPKMLGDETYHYGYPANFQDLDYLERLKGEVLEYADIKGTKVQTSDDGSTYKAPIFSFTLDESDLRPYMVSRTGVFYGASGGLAFNLTKQCILGPHHGFSSGSSESFSIFMVLGWQGLAGLLR